MILKRFTLGLTCAALLMAMIPGAAVAETPAYAAFERTWARTDKPVENGAAQRTWMWGPESITGEMVEFYEGARDNSRTVQYFDKSRMEINHHQGVPDENPWYVTNGRLAWELITGQMQIGDATFVERAAAEIPVAGDPTSPSVPTYAALAALLNDPAHPLDSVIVTSVARNGTIEEAPRLSAYDVTAYYQVAETGHVVARPFWDFMTSTGPVFENEQIVSDALFENPFYATGYPITEAHWTRAVVNGVETDVLVQAFERRVLTYTPTNPVGWQVESGNVGRHYFQWRYILEPPANIVVANIPTGPDTLEYRFKGDPPPATMDYGPYAFSVALDGTFWVADAAGHRLVQFGRDGQRLNVIDLASQGAQSVLDVEARNTLIWVWWINFDLGRYKIQAYEPDGTLVRDVDLDPSLIHDATTTATGIAVTDSNAVLMEMDHGFRYVRVVDSNGNADATTVEAGVFSGHAYRLERLPDTYTTKVIHVDDRPIEISADPGALGVELGLLPDPVTDSFFIKRYSVLPTQTVSLSWAVEHRSVDGTLLGSALVPLDQRYVDIQNPYSVGPDGKLYMLMPYQDHVEILRIGFTKP